MSNIEVTKTLIPTEPDAIQMLVGFEYAGEGGSEAFEPEWHWSSTQYSSTNAWNQYFDDGDADDNSKRFEARVVLCRLIPLNT